jgi:acetylornithine deacetylase/succinyl-diaminopimelate desuccinylase-like protein
MRSEMRLPAAAAVLLSLVALPLAQNQDLAFVLKGVLERANVKTALAYPDAHREAILDEWKSITEVHAPSGKERARAEFVRRLLGKNKLDKVYFDSTGNLIAIRKGSGDGKAVVFDAHLDTVFAEDIRINVEIKDGKIFAPGVGDDTRNVEAILASIRALDEAGIRTNSDLVFVFTVEEETTMEGARQFIAENKDRIGQYVALDGGYEGITYAGIGINWYRHHFIGAGGHTRSRTPPYSASLPAARAIARIYSLDVPADPPSHVNIGMIGGGGAVNAKAADAWFTVDLRSTDSRVIERLERQIATIVREEAERAGMQPKTEVLSKLPASQLAGNRESFTVRMSEAVHHALGFENVSVTPTGSNNANLALLAGIPAISTGCAPCANSHAVNEWCWIEPFYRGIRKIILLEIALAGIDS